MIELVSHSNIPLPKLYLAHNKAEAEQCLENGLPFVRMADGTVEKVIRVLLRPTLERMFPDIDFNMLFGEKEFFTQISWDNPPKDAEASAGHLNKDDGWASIATSERLFKGTKAGKEMQAKIIEEYIGDKSSYVNLDVLQELKLLPSFMGDILTNIKRNIVGHITWTDGYNKKLGVGCGNFNGSADAPNLIILDISGSIPRGISATMLTLLDTLRTQVNADVIVTGGSSYYWSMDDELPTAEELRKKISCNNESEMFANIIMDNISGREWGHVISFGDDDTPKLAGFINKNMAGTIVHKVHHYHTWRSKVCTGYAKWCHNDKYCKMLEEPVFNNKWAKFFKDGKEV